MSLVKSRRRPDEQEHGSPERNELGGFLWQVRRLEQAGLYRSGDISRGVDRVHMGSGESYNEMHKVDFYRELDYFLEKKKDGVVRILDVGCGLGFFLKDLLDYAESGGVRNRVEVHGINPVKNFRAIDQDPSDSRELKPVLGSDVIHVAHAENIPFEDNSFDMVVSTAGAYAKYGAHDSENFKTHGRIRVLNELYRVTAPGGKIYLKAACEYMDGLMDASLKFFQIKHRDAVILGGGPLNPQTQIQKPDQT